MKDGAIIRAILIGILCGMLAIAWPTADETETPDSAPTTTTTTTATTTTTEAPTTTTTTKADPPVYYPLTDWERDQVERVVMAEAGGEPYQGQMAVAQCILNASKSQGVPPAQAVVKMQYTKARPEPTESVKRAVSAVFDDGATVFDRDVLYFYAPAMVSSGWHESQEYVTTIGGHRFFKEAR